VSPAKTDEPIKMPFGLQTRAGPMSHVLHGEHLGTTWRIRLNEPSTRGGNAALCQIILTTVLFFTAILGKLGQVSDKLAEFKPRIVLDVSCNPNKFSKQIESDKDGPILA